MISYKTSEKQHTPAGYRGARPKTDAAVPGLCRIHFSTHYKKVLEIIETT